METRRVLAAAGGRALDASAAAHSEPSPFHEGGTNPNGGVTKGDFRVGPDEE